MKISSVIFKGMRIANRQFKDIHYQCNSFSAICPSKTAILCQERKKKNVGSGAMSMNDED